MKSTVLQASEPGGTPLNLIIGTRFGTTHSFHLRYILAPFFTRHRALLEQRFPQGIELWDLMEAPPGIRQGDKLLCYEATDSQIATIREVAAQCGANHSCMFNYENPLAYHYYAWRFCDDFLELFGTVLSTTALYADAKKFFWTPIWNFLRNFEDRSQCLAMIDTPPNARLRLAVNPIRSGGHVSRERIEIVDFFVANASQVHVFGSEELFQELPFSAWVQCRKGEIPYSPSPYRYLNKVPVFERYAFVLTCENAFVDGYISEKLGEPLAALSVPVYFGYPYIERYLPRLFNQGAINGHQYASLDELLRALETMSEEEYSLRLDTIRRHRNEYFELTEFAGIWEFALAMLFDLPEVYTKNQLYEINLRHAACNSGPERSERRARCEDVLSSGITGAEYEKSMRAILQQ